MYCILLMSTRQVYEAGVVAVPKEIYWEDISKEIKQIKKVKRKEKTNTGVFETCSQHCQHNLKNKNVTWKQL
jgi:hypothetical protein